MISVAHAQIAFGKFTLFTPGQFSEITIPHFLFAGAERCDCNCLLRCMSRALSRRRRFAKRPFCANARGRCAPARCAGARAERLVADGEDVDSGVASINSRIVGVQRMIKNSRII